MRVRKRLIGLILAMIGSASGGCGDSSDPGPGSPDISPTSHSTRATTTRTTSTSGPDRPTVLPTGKSDLELTPGIYRSPRGFAPSLLLLVSETGWRSTHRGLDGFDLSQPDPTKDAPLVAIVLVSPPELNASAALAGIEARASDARAKVVANETTVAGVPARVVDVRGGQGPLVLSLRHGIGLDTAPGQRARVFVTEIAGAPVVITILVSDGTRWQAGLRVAMPLLSSLTVAG